MWEASKLPGVRKCGRVRHADVVTVRVSDGVAGYSGLVSCGSVWADPVCSAKIMSRRAVEVGSMLSLAAAEGLVLGFGTLTMRHHVGQPLAFLWGAGFKGWRRAISGKAWASAQARHGVVGWVRIWEVTIGLNGWHVHVHFVVVLEAGSDANTLDELCDGMYGRWSRGLKAAGLGAPLRRGQDWHIVSGDQAGDDIAEYLSKLGTSGGDALGLELTHVHPGRSRGFLGTDPAWSLLDDYAELGDLGALKLWHEWERASKGKRQLGFSSGFRERFRAGAEKSDEEIAAEELGSSDDDLLAIEADGWREMVRHPERLSQLLDAAEHGGLGACIGLLAAWGDVPYHII